MGWNDLLKNGIGVTFPSTLLQGLHPYCTQKSSCLIIFVLPNCLLLWVLFALRVCISLPL